MGRVIKAQGTGAAGQPVSFQKFERRAHSGKVQLPTLEESMTPTQRAATQAEIIVRTARMEAEQILAEARRVGHEDGYRDGRAEGMATVQSLIGRLEDDIADVQAETTQFLESLEPELLKLCLEIVEKVIRHEAKTSPGVVLRVIKLCLRRVKDSHEVRVRVNPDEVAAVRAARDDLLAIAEGINAVNIVDDRRISAGGCVIETATGDLDATVETQLGRIEQKLTETLENDRDET